MRIETLGRSETEGRLVDGMAYCQLQQPPTCVFGVFCRPRHLLVASLREVKKAGGGRKEWKGKRVLKKVNKRKMKIIKSKTKWPKSKRKKKRTLESCL